MEQTDYSTAVNVFLNPSADETVIEAELAAVGFADRQAAATCLRRLATTPETRTALAQALPALLNALSEVADPNPVLVNIERFVKNFEKPIDLYHDFAQNPRLSEILTTIFSGSRFLTEILQHRPHYFERLTAHQQLAHQKEAHEFLAEVQAKIKPLIDTGGPTDPAALLNALRRFQRWELLRIGVADLLGVFELENVTTQLSYLADSLIEAGLTVATYLTNVPAEDFCVIGMGKLGGTELNYSSDIDLVFLVPENSTVYWPLGQKLIDILAQTTSEGFLYRVDMRLRPWGQSGPLVSTFDGYRTYFEKHAGFWEKQALLKARVVAGEQALGQALLRHIKSTVFRFKDLEIRHEVHDLKQRIEAQLKKRGQQWGEVKLGQGSIRDVEFVTQFLQLSHGPRQPNLYASGTLEAMSQLSGSDLITPAEFRVLRDGYIFLRTVEHHLQLMNYRQTHQLPTDEKLLNHLAYRLGFKGTNAGQNFVARYEQHSAAIRIVYQQYLTEPGHRKRVKTASLLPHLTRMHPTYVTTFSDADIAYHAALAEGLDGNTLIKVEAVPVDKETWRVTIVGYDYIGQLSLICGLFLIYDFNIIDGDVFSYGPATSITSPSGPPERRAPGKRHPRYRTRSQSLPLKNSRQRKIVDVFTVRSSTSNIDQSVWRDYATDLADLIQLLPAGKQRLAQGQVAKRVALSLPKRKEASVTLYPIDIDIDNDASQRHTVLRIDAVDTIGFLYEFTNALALTGVNIRRVTVDSVGNRVQDILYVTDARHRKITNVDKQRELRVAAVLIKHFTHLLPHSPDPEAALLHFREFMATLFTRPDWAEDLMDLERPEVLETLARLLGVSDFLWDDFLRMQHRNLFPILQNIEALAERKSRSVLREEMEIILNTKEPGSSAADAINAFKDREIFRIDMRQIQGHITEFDQFSAELTELAELIAEAAYRIATRKLRIKFGLPRLQNKHPCPMTLCALGKCGGRELGYASDIELMFVYAGNGKTTGPRVITTAEFFNKAVSEVSGIIKAKKEGIFEVDLRLRPYGKAGALAVSVQSFEQYFGLNGDAWPYERQALVKLRPIAGDKKLGKQIVRIRDEIIYYGQPFDVAAMRAMRERQIRHLVTPGTLNAKFSPGGLVDIEYLVQGLQMTHGHRHVELRQTNTYRAMQALAKYHILSPEEFAALSDAYIFFRHLIDALRMVRGHAKDLTVPPVDSDDFAFLGRRLNYDQAHLSALNDTLHHHVSTVQTLNSELLDQTLTA